MYKHLTSEQRYAIFACMQKGMAKKDIASMIVVHPSTVGREIKRNQTKNGKYVFNKAHEMSERRKRRCPGNRRTDDLVMLKVKTYILDEEWSPRQISGFLNKEGVSISHTTIYNYIHADETGKLAEHCRHRLKYRKKTPLSKRQTKATNIKNRVSIHERPVEADGKRFGDWEMDLIVDCNSNAILTLTERSTNYIIAEKLPEGKKSEPLAKAVCRLLLPFKGNALKTITTDNGGEFAGHEMITEKLNVPVYFADSYSSWQKGAVENANKLIRQYLPKCTDLSSVSNKALHNIQLKINRRPREKLDFSSPVVEFYKNAS